MHAVWWVWLVAGFGLGVLEVLAPGFIFLGFAIGAVATGLLLALGLGGSLPFVLLIFAVLSLGAWAGLKRYFGSKEGQVKLWDKDVNDN
jgi:membrane protein implicated in regulation of membrane protease activity